MSGILGTALSGLMAFQRALDTTSHNIANVNTEGYSRQRVDINSGPSYLVDGHFFGQGVNVSSVSRSYDQFVSGQLNSSTSAFAESKTLSSLAGRIDNILASESSSLAPALKSFFNAVNGVANDPASISARQTLTSEAESLSHQFNQMSSQFSELRKSADDQMQGAVDDINNYAESLAALNAKIALESSRNRSTQLPNDLLDQRDLLINKISEKVSVSTVAQENGTIDVFIGKGQSLVLGATTVKLGLASSNDFPGRKEIALDGHDITKNISGGELAGMLKFRDEVLEPAQQKLGVVAAGVAMQFNALHTSGYDLNGDAGTEMFKLGQLPVTAKSGTVGTISAQYDAANIDQLNPSDYELTYNGGNFSLKRLSDNSVTTITGTPPSTLNGPGFTITADASIQANDSFLIRPTFEAAQNVTAQIKNPEKIAAAGTTGGSGTPVTGDNTVALKLAGLETKTSLYGGKTTITGAYTQLTSKVGSQTHSAQVSNSAHEALFNQAKSDRENVSGVNLDEEAANLIKYQQYYQAAAQMVNVANTVFDTLIGALRK